MRLLALVSKWQISWPKRRPVRQVHYLRSPLSLPLQVPIQIFGMLRACTIRTLTLNHLLMQYQDLTPELPCSAKRPWRSPGPLRLVSSFLERRFRNPLSPSSAIESAPAGLRSSHRPQRSLKEMSTSFLSRSTGLSLQTTLNDRFGFPLQMLPFPSIPLFLCRSA